MATFNREKFKALNPGVTDAQIDAYLSSPQAKIDSAAPPPQQMGMGPPFPSPVPGGGNPLAGAAGAAMESLSGLRGIGLGVGGLGAILGGKALVGKIMRGAQKAPPPVAAASEAAAPAPTVSRSTRVEITPELRRRFPALKHFKSGETISAAQLDKIKLAKAGVPTRPINVQGKPAARAPAQTTEPSYTGGRGASGPELARRAAARSQAVEGASPNLKLVPQEMPQLPPAQTMEEQLQRALAAEAQMAAKGFSGEARAPMLKALRSAIGEAGSSISPMVMPGNAATPEQELQNAVEQFLMIKHYDPQHYAALLHSIMGPHQ